jgi:hypothetical protein
MLVGCWLEGNLLKLPKESRLRLFISFSKKPEFLGQAQEWCKKLGTIYIYHWQSLHSISLQSYSQLAVKIFIHLSLVIGHPLAT